jgi:hypothetical protein
VQGGVAAQLTLLLGGLLCENVASKSLRTLDASAAAYLEALGSASFGFRLGHGYHSFSDLNPRRVAEAISTCRPEHALG